MMKGKVPGDASPAFPGFEISRAGGRRAASRRRSSMLPRFRLAFGMAVILATGVGQARAQYYPGYGAFGWGGWGGASTAQGDIARGLGFYNMETGAALEETAISNRINEEAVARWN